MDDDVAAEIQGAGRLSRPWTTDASAVIQGIQQRIKRPVPVRKSVALERARQLQLAKMAKLNDNLRQEVKIAADEALHSAAAVQIGLDRAQSQTALIQRLQARNDDLDRDLDDCRARLVQLKRAQGSEVLQVARERNAQKALTRLESRLQRSLLKQNAMHAANEAFKQQQEAMRRDLAIADAVQVGLGQQLATVQQRICAVTAVFDDIVQHNQRSQETLDALQRAGDGWHAGFQADWAALTQLLAEQTRELHNRRAMFDRQLRRTTRGQHEPESGAGDRARDHDGRHNPFLKKQTGADLDRQASMKAIAAKQVALDQYVQKEAAIGAATGVDDLDQLILKFRDQEQNSFRLFREANELARARDEAEVEATEAKAVLVAVGDCAAGADGEQIGARLSAVAVDLERTSQRETVIAFDLKELLGRINHLFGSMIAPNGIVSLQDGLEMLEAYVGDAISAYKDLYHLRDKLFDEDFEPVLPEDAFDDQIGVDICIPTLSDAEPDEDMQPNSARRTSVSRKSKISSADNAISLFVRGVTDTDIRRMRKRSSMARRQTQSKDSTHRRSDAAISDGNDFSF